MLFSEVKYLRSKGYSGDEVRYANPSFESLARDVRFEASTVREFADLDVVTEKLPTLHGPMLLDCKTLGAMLLQTEYMSAAKIRARRQSESQATKVEILA